MNLIKSRDLSLFICFIALISSLFLFSCVESRRLKSEDNQLVCYTNKAMEGRCISLSLHKDNSFKYRHMTGSFIVNTEGIYMDSDTAFYLYSTKYGPSYFKQVLKNCDKAYLYPHNVENNIDFEREKVTAGLKEYVFIKGDTLYLDQQCIECGVLLQK